jgi:AraC-like DNA-binding protein
MMFHLGPGQRLIELDGSPCGIVLQSGFLAGLQQRPATFETIEAETRVAAVQLLPLGGWLLMGGLPQYELTGRVLDLDSALGPSSGVTALHQRMLEATDFGAALDHLESWLEKRFAAHRPGHPSARKAAALLRHGDGGLRVESLAQRTALSPRRLRELFLREVGVSPKRLARILRFRRAVERLAAEPALDLCSLALDCGYSDQAHLCREFRELGTLTPSAYVAAHGAGLDGPHVISG